MRILTFLLFISINASSQLNTMSFNIRYNTPSDSANAWPYRINKVTSQIIFHDIHLLGIQEALHDQVITLRDSLKKFKYTGVARDDGDKKGEYSCIFYDTTRLKLIKGSTMWLSEQPTVPGSKSWDAAITRVVTWASFRDLLTKKVFFVFNTHFDHIGKTARAESAKLLLKWVEEIAGNKPVIVMGDFNAPVNDVPIITLTDQTKPYHLINAKNVSRTPHYGPTGTFNAFRSKEINNDAIDHIFIRGKITVHKHATLSQSWEGRFASDHFAVMAIVSF